MNDIHQLLEAFVSPAIFVSAEGLLLLSLSSVREEAADSRFMDLKNRSEESEGTEVPRGM
jgi:hypothetical protein